MPARYRDSWRGQWKVDSESQRLLLRCEMPSPNPLPQGEEISYPERDEFLGEYD
jgi:hypothetical protein